MSAMFISRVDRLRRLAIPRVNCWGRKKLGVSFYHYFYSEENYDYFEEKNDLAWEMTKHFAVQVMSYKKRLSGFCVDCNHVVTSSQIGEYSHEALVRNSLVKQSGKIVLVDHDIGFAVLKLKRMVNIPSMPRFGPSPPYGNLGEVMTLSFNYDSAKTPIRLTGHIIGELTTRHNVPILMSTCALDYESLGSPLVNTEGEIIGMTVGGFKSINYTQVHAALPTNFILEKITKILKQRGSMLGEISYDNNPIGYSWRKNARQMDNIFSPYQNFMAAPAHAENTVPPVDQSHNSYQALGSVYGSLPSSATMTHVGSVYGLTYGTKYGYWHCAA